MMRLYQSLLDNEDDLIKTSDKATNPFELLGVKKIWVIGPTEPETKDIPIMMEFLNYIDWSKIKKEHLDIKFNKVPGPVYNGFTKEYREKINIVSYLLCKLAVKNNYDTFDIKKELEKYFISNYKSKYTLKIKYFKQGIYTEKQLGMYLDEQNNYTKGIEIIFNK